MRGTGGVSGGAARGRVVAADGAAIRAAAALLRQGELVVFPTETVYGLGADAGNDRACAAIFAIKARPRFNPLIVHVADVAAAERIARFDDRARALARRYWPGPLTLVLARRPDVPLSPLVSAGLDTVAVRAPAHPVARALLAAAAVPIAAPSANASGSLSPTRAAHVQASGLADRVALVLDGGPCPVGVESTIVDLSGAAAVLLRPGGLAAETVAELVGPLRPAPSGVPPRAPGQLSRHYAPSRPLRLNALEARPGEALLAFGPAAPPSAALNLSASGNLEEAAANLFAMLHALDRPEVAGIAVMPIPERGLGLAINDRLRRAAAPPPDNDDRGPALPCVLPDVEEAT
jgi:L-threonylcarbamoyladenylate synthase